MKERLIPFYVLLCLLVGLGFLIRTTYHFFIIVLDGGIILKESNFFIAFFELCLVSIIVMILILFSFQQILSYSKKFAEYLRR